MTHAIAVFFRNGHPIPLTPTDFRNRYKGADRAAQLTALCDQGLVAFEDLKCRREYTVTDAGLAFAVATLGIDPLPKDRSRDACAAFRKNAAPDVIRMRDEGMTIRAIAARIGYSYGYVCRILKENAADQIEGVEA